MLMADDVGCCIYLHINMTCVSLIVAGRDSDAQLPLIYNLVYLTSFVSVRGI